MCRTLLRIRRSLLQICGSLLRYMHVFVLSLGYARSTFGFLCAKKHTNTHTHTYTHTHARMHTHTHTLIHYHCAQNEASSRINIFICITWKNIYTHTYVYNHTYICIYIYTCMWIYKHRSCAYFRALFSNASLLKRPFYWALILSQMSAAASAGACGLFCGYEGLFCGLKGLFCGYIGFLAVHWHWMRFWSCSKSAPLRAGSIANV